MKYLKLLVILLAFTASSYGQKYEIKGETLVKVDNIKKKQKQTWQDTDIFVTIKNVKYNVKRGKRGGYFIIRTSKRTGKPYFQYLEITNKPKDSI